MQNQILFRQWFHKWLLICNYFYLINYSLCIHLSWIHDHLIISPVHMVPLEACQNYLTLLMICNLFKLLFPVIVYLLCPLVLLYTTAIHTAGQGHKAKESNKTSWSICTRTNQCSLDDRWHQANSRYVPMKYPSGFNAASYLQRTKGPL
jgi:hypothetical protein